MGLITDVCFFLHQRRRGCSWFAGESRGGCRRVWGFCVGLADVLAFCSHQTDQVCVLRLFGHEIRGEDVVVCYYDASFWAGLNGNPRKAVKRFPGGRPVLRLSVPYGHLPRKQCINVQESWWCV